MIGSAVPSARSRHSTSPPASFRSVATASPAAETPSHSRCHRPSTWRGTSALMIPRLAHDEPAHIALTAYHTRYFAHQLTRRCASDEVEKLAGTLVDAQVDLNPHQVEAALFAFRSPLSTGALLADEVGLGKTIEAGLVISQKWAEHKRRILVIAPANLRKQWRQELGEKFFLPAHILETRSYSQARKQGAERPFEPEPDDSGASSSAPTSTPRGRPTRFRPPRGTWSSSTKPTASATSTSPATSSPTSSRRRWLPSPSCC